MKRLLNNLAPVILLLFPIVIIAGSVNGILSSSVYSFVREDLNNNSDRHIRTYQSLLLTGNNIGLKNSRFIVSSVFYYDPASDFGDGKSYSAQIYNFNFHKRLLSNRLKIILGRHTVYSPSAFGRIDGLSGEYIYKTLKFKLFGGGYIPGTGFAGDPIANHLVGSEIKWLKNERMQLSIGLSNKAHAREIYKSIKTNRIIEVPATIQRRLGLKGYWSIDRISLYMLARIHPTLFEMKDFNAHIDYSHGRIDHLSFEFKFFEPRIPENSIFSVFDTYSTKEYRLSSDFKFTEKFTGSFQYRLVQFNDDHSQVLNLAVRDDHIYVQFTNQSGYGGKSNHVTGQISEQFKRTVLYGRVTLGNYRLIEGDITDRATLVLGSRVPIYSKMSIKTELQMLRNKYYAKDVRFLLNLSYRL
ncbi:MAG: hypothetical protein HQ556_09910 [Candidatus Marinimicrobia bacterium]|nr:hypothetical protein [Candidatus Neomarinimicrobiota bacterium]